MEWLGDFVLADSHRIRNLDQDLGPLGKNGFFAARGVACPFLFLK